jgi:NAD(P)-dependent dehydrogenase (short-subunit alcohol dehydrogenase family)
MSQGLPNKDISEHQMNPKPRYDAPFHKGSEKLKGKVAIVTGGDSGIGRSVSILFAREGANVAIVYFQNDKDAEDTKSLVEKEGGKCITIKGDVSIKKVCEEAVEKTVKEFGKLDILVNNAGTSHLEEDFMKLTEEYIDRTFRVNIYSQFFMCQAALKHMKEGSSIINTTSVNSFMGNESAIDYAATKGAITAFTYSLSQNLASKKIRVNGVAPGRKYN